MERELTEAKKKPRSRVTVRTAPGMPPARSAASGFLGRVVSGVEPKDLKSLADDGKKTLGSGVVAFVASVGDGKASARGAVTDDLTSKVSAVDLGARRFGCARWQGGRRAARHGPGRRPDGGRAAEAIEAVPARFAG